MHKELEKDMSPKKISKTFRKYPTERSKHKSTYARYVCCYCNQEFEADYFSVLKGATISCGCRKGKTGTHGLGTHRFYETWQNMKSRCNSPIDISYKNYGGRGIKVCEEWMDVVKFIEWCDSTYPNIEGLNIGRIDVNGGYNPDNCRWTDRTTQNSNQRKRSNNTSGYVGVSWDARNNKWNAQLSYKYKAISIGRFETIEKAVLARDNYIIQNNLPHKLSTEYEKEMK